MRKKIETIPTEIDSEKTNILIMMDDAWKSQYIIGFKTMKKKKMVGSIAVITDMVDKPDYMNNAELFDVYTYGWDLMSHTRTHPDLSSLSRKQQQNEILKSKNGLNNIISIEA